MSEGPGYYLMLLSVHGLVRGAGMELGADADTGGQVKYVIELARMLGEHPRVDRVDVVTRRVEGAKIDPVYAEPLEDLGPGVRIVRVPFGPRRYLAKESLWPYLGGLVDNLVQYLRAEGRAPDLVHGHYADAGYVTTHLAALLNVPMAFTGHSLGRVKRERLLERGSTEEQLEKRYKITRRIAAEELALDHAAFVVASTAQEIEQQYALYDHYRPKTTFVVPPGVDLSRYHPPGREKPASYGVSKDVFRFLRDPRKPLVFAISRADPRKNVQTLIEAFGRNEALREKANLLLVLGTRDDIRTTSQPTRRVLNDVLHLIDRYDLYGSVAYPKQHDPDEVPDFYKLAAATRGVFVNPALTEPFGLTLLEAAASGLPVVATEDGGPRDILSHCKNGVLVDPMDPDAMGRAIQEAIEDRARWRRWSRAGIQGVERHYSWRAHANRYMTLVERHRQRPKRRSSIFSVRRRLISADRALVADIDGTLIGDKEGLETLLRRLDEAGGQVAFGIATGRSVALTKEALAEWKIPTPTALITSVGTEIHYGPNLVKDDGWADHISYRWDPEALRRAMEKIPGVEPQGTEGQAEFKISYILDPDVVPPTKTIQRHLRQRRLSATVIRSHGQYLDLLPARASKGLAVRYFAIRWGIPIERVLVAGDSGNDEEMLTGNALAVVVGNHDSELEHIRGLERVFFAEGTYAQGILEGIDHYDFLGEIRIPREHDEA